MMTRLQWAGVMAGIGLLAGCGTQPPPPDVHRFMLEQVQPAAQTYWDAVQYVSDSTGNHEIFPSTPEEWQRTRKAAERLQELGAELKTPAYAQGRADWEDFAQGLIDVSKIAAKAAADENRDKVFEVGATVYNVCSACHQIYLPKEPEAGTPADKGE